EQIISGILVSDEYLHHQIMGWFNQYLGRPTDDASLITFTNFIKGGATLNQALTEVLASQEYFANHGGTAAGFVQGLYRDLLHRDPAGGEADGWILMGTGQDQRRAVVKGILQGAEFNNLELNGLYATLLRRGADPAGQGTFLPQLAAGADPRLVAGQIVMSGE